MAQKRTKRIIGALGILLVLAAIFVGASLGAKHYQGLLTQIVQAGGAFGVIAYILFTAVFTIFLIPLDVSVLIPLATHAWGPLSTALMSVAGWTLGSSVSFYLVRRYGTEFAKRLAGEERIRRAEHAAPKEHLFWWVLLMQAFLSVDFISYIFGLFTEIRMGPYVLATFLGDFVPGFFFAYVGTLPVWYEVGGIAVGLAAAAVFFFRYRGRYFSWNE